MPSNLSLTKVKIERFMSLNSVEFEVGQLNVLIGANGAGKSNVLSLFDLVGSIIEQRLRLWIAQHGQLDRIVFGGSKQSPNFSFELDFANGRQGYRAAIAEGSGGVPFFQFEAEWGTRASGTDPVPVDLGVGHSETRLFDEVDHVPGGVSAWTLECLKGWRRYHFHDTSLNAGVMKSQAIEDNTELRRDASNLAPFLLRLKQTDPNSLDRIVDAIRSVAPFFDDFVLDPDPVRTNQIRLRWRHRDNDLFGDASMLSDGTLRFICLAAALLQPNPPTVIFIDEPELGLHPYAVHLLAEMLEATAKKCQIIVATQSVTLLDKVVLKDVLVADRVDGETQIHRPNSSDVDRWLERYSLGELWEKNLLGGRPGAAR
jgi:predicted ATPase